MNKEYYHVLYSIKKKKNFAKLLWYKRNKRCRGLLLLENQLITESKYHITLLFIFFPLHQHSSFVLFLIYLDQQGVIHML